MKKVPNSSELHNAVNSYFDGVSAKSNDPDVRDQIVNHARSGQYNQAHRLSIQNGLLDKKNPYGQFNNFPLKMFAEYDKNKHTQEGGVVKSMTDDIHPATRSIGLSLGALRHIAKEKWNNLDEKSLNKITNAVAEHGFPSKGSRPLDASDIVQYARKTVKQYPTTEEHQFRRSYNLLMFGLFKGMYGTDRDPEKQRKQDLDTSFFRKPKTYRGTHPKHEAIMAYFNHFSKPLSEDARATIMHDARLGEYGSAQRKLARRNDGLPAGLDGLKFGDYQIEMVEDMADEGIFD